MNNLKFNEKNTTDRPGLVVVEDLNTGKPVQYLSRHTPMMDTYAVERLYRDGWSGRKVTEVIGNKLYSGWNFSARELHAIAAGESAEGAHVCSENFGRKLHSILVQKKL